MAKDQSEKYLIIDTNIIQLVNSKPLARSDQIVDYLLAIIKLKYELAISEITIYEAIQRCSEAKEKEVLNKLNLFTHLEVSKQSLITAAWLADVYRSESIPDSQISDCDRIIAATALSTNSLIITANGNDYPRPFFNEKDRKLIFYKNGNRDLLIVIYLLQPDIDVFRYRLLKRPKK